MGLFDHNPYVAEFQIAILNCAKRTLDVSPRRPQGELAASVKEIRASGLLVAAIALYSQNRPCAYDERRWLERDCALGMKLQIVERPSKKYRKLVDCIIYPTPEPMEYPLSEEFFRRLMLSAGYGRMLN